MTGHAILYFSFFSASSIKNDEGEKEALQRTLAYNTKIFLLLELSSRGSATPSSPDALVASLLVFLFPGP